MPDPDHIEDIERESVAVKTQTVRSEDGTRIGFAKVGSGPVPLVIVHGALNSAEQWLSVAKALAEPCTCYVMDRRGRGRSGDAAAYDFEREIEDIAAVLQAAGPEAFLLGHSSGAIYALEAARRQSIEGLALYEPPLHFQRQFEEIFERIRPLMEQEQFNEAVVLFYREEAGVPEEQLSVLRSTPLWRHMVALAPTAHREWEALLEAGLTVERFREVSEPTLLLTGTVTQDHTSFATRALEATLPDARVVLLEDQAHAAHRMAPELVAKEVADFMLTVG
ncbi:MAG TPA: alpha/beta hydrolase [Candidatus Sulfomarinibacteraceae bacterium]|nr:alpha/beta hydrolase [Candidatus Sulfomarinibacteraceae bacterium]